MSVVKGQKKEQGIQNNRDMNKNGENLIKTFDGNNCDKQVVNIKI